MRPSTARPAARAGTVTQAYLKGVGPARALALSVALARPTAADSDSDVPLTATSSEPEARMPAEASSFQ